LFAILVVLLTSWITRWSVDYCACDIHYRSFRIHAAF